jgi:hypothetical protein
MLCTRKLTLVVVVLSALGAAACGSSSSSTGAPGSQAAPASGGAGTAGAGTASGAGTLSADANSAATGDIPDNQVFLVFRDRQAGFSMKYPEGWTQAGAAGNITFRDKNNVVRVRITNGPAPTPALVTAQLSALKGTDPTLAVRSAKTVSIGGHQAVKTVYTTQSAPNAVTGRRVLLIVDRYELTQGRKLAIVDLGTPKGVDNVDAYRMMIESFQWQ